MKMMKKLITGILVTVLLITSTEVFAEEPEVFEYYDADNDRNCIEYHYGDTAGILNDTFSYYDADNDTYVTEYYYGSDSDDEADYGWYPDYSDLYQDEYQAAWYASVSLNDWADFYSLEGEYICTIPEGTWVQPLESIGRSGDITYIMYNGYQGYVYTTLLLHPPYVVCCEPTEPTYDEIYQSGGYIVQLAVDANLRDENGNIITAIPAGYAVEFISYDETTGRCWVRWNGLFGSVIASAIWSDSGCCYADEDECNYEECPEEGFGYAKIKPSIGANVRDCEGNVITAVPCGEEVMLLEPLNDGGRTLIKWGCFTGTVLTSCLKVCSA